MKGSEAWQSYKDSTINASNISRQLAFANACVCWFFKSNEITFPHYIYFALFFIVIFFVLDVSQYLITVFLYRLWIKKCIRKYRNAFEDDKQDVEQPVWLNSPARCLLYTKILICT